ncbi:hypothetical protein EVAR_86528_1 [Eumeta japonica]|uniref:Uncharacterized protein n=1 Tax=Eumeta variegata TaxID=151549 RepID=A0A4C1VPQ3_EUMVA|nr:hypothetical protein EVAR_86528_1 [Eumeta japonica]
MKFEFVQRGSESNFLERNRNEFIYRMWARASREGWGRWMGPRRGCGYICRWKSGSSRGARQSGRVKIIPGGARAAAVALIALLCVSEINAGPRALLNVVRQAALSHDTRSRCAADVATIGRLPDGGRARCAIKTIMCVHVFSVNKATGCERRVCGPASGVGQLSGQVADNPGLRVRNDDRKFRISRIYTECYYPPWPIAARRRRIKVSRTRITLARLFTQDGNSGHVLRAPCALTSAARYRGQLSPQTETPSDG